MKKSDKHKRIFENVAKNFLLMFNRSSMYKLEHPYTRTAISEFHQSLTEALTLISPVVILMSHDQLFVEEQPFDARLNTSRLAAHFKRVAIQSVSFEQGLAEEELHGFFKVFSDPQTHPSADAMNQAIAGLNVVHAKLNHVIYQKMTIEDKVVSRSEMDESNQSDQPAMAASIRGEVVNMMFESIMMEELEKSLSLKELMADPAGFSEHLINGNSPGTGGRQAQGHLLGAPVAEQLHKISAEIDTAMSNQAEANLFEMAAAVFDMKRQLLAGIDSRKALGVIYDDEGRIRDEVEALSEKVLMELVKQEYRRGDISIKRLAQILRRLIPEANELKRLLPKIKAALLGEGMPLDHYLELIRELAKELQSEELADVLYASAEEIGVAGDRLLDELKSDPKGAAELIYLASEIRRGTGDDQVLTQLLVDYVERIGGNAAIDEAARNQSPDTEHLRQVVSRVESGLLGSLKGTGMDPDILAKVEQRLRERIDDAVNKIVDKVAASQQLVQSTTDLGKTSVFRVLEDSVVEGDELYVILQQVRESLRKRNIDENNFHEIYREILRIKDSRESDSDRKELPPGVLGYANTLFFIQKEIHRASRYDTPFSIISFSIVNITPQKRISQGSLKADEVTRKIMAGLVNVLRQSDIVGILNKRVIAVLMPMTDEKNARLALNRILRRLHQESFTVGSIPLKVQFAGAVSSYDPENCPNFESFVNAAEAGLKDLIMRLKTIQDLT